MKNEVDFPSIDRNNYLAFSGNREFTTLSMISDGSDFKFNTSYYVYVYYTTQDVYGSTFIPASTARVGGSFTISGIVFLSM